MHELHRWKTRRPLNKDLNLFWPGLGISGDMAQMRRQNWKFEIQTNHYTHKEKFIATNARYGLVATSSWDTNVVEDIQTVIMNSLVNRKMLDHIWKLEECEYSGFYSEKIEPEKQLVHGAPRELKEFTTMEMLDEILSRKLAALEQPEISKMPQAEIIDLLATYRKAI